MFLNFSAFYQCLTCEYYTVSTIVSKICTMEHFCTLFIFRGLFFQLFGHSLCENFYPKTYIVQNRRRYIQYMKTTDSEK